MRILVSFFLAIFSLNTLAQTDVSGASDYPGLQRFPGAYIVQYKTRTDPDYRFITGGLEKINGLIVSESERRLSGQLTKITYRIPEGHSPEEAFRQMLSQIETAGFKANFQCASRDCGSSNMWANAVFRYSRLYGVDSTQHYAAFSNGNRYLALYAVKRGNKRVYLQLEVLETDEVDLEQSLKQQIYTELQTSDDGLETIKNYLGGNPDKHIWLVGSYHGEGDKAAQIDQAAQALERLVSRLVTMGADRQQIKTHNLGAFIPETAKDEGQRFFIISE